MTTHIHMHILLYSCIFKRSTVGCELGHFLGLTVGHAPGDIDQSRHAQTTVYESDVDDDVTTNDVTDASEKFDEMMRNLGAAGLLEKFVFCS